LIGYTFHQPDVRGLVCKPSSKENSKGKRIVDNERLGTHDHDTEVSAETRPVRAVARGNAGRTAPPSNVAVPTATTPYPVGSLSEIAAYLQAANSRQLLAGSAHGRAQRITSPPGDVCPLCYAGYTSGHAENLAHPDLVYFCFNCQRLVETLCRMVAASLTVRLKRAVLAFDVLTRFLGDVAPFSPMAQVLGRPYE